MSIVNTFKHEADFWRTPSAIRDATLSLVPEGTRLILDPCAGACDLCDFGRYEYELYDLNPRSSDVKKKDFFNLSGRWDCIVMNPPFNIGRRFIDHALDIADSVIVIAPFSVVKPYCQLIQGWTGEFWWSSAFGITFPLGAFLLQNKFSLGEPKYRDLFWHTATMPLELYPRTKDVDMRGRRGLVFYTTILGTYHGFTEIDPRTGYEYWLTPITEDTDGSVLDFLTRYSNNCKGHKKGEPREACYFVPYDDPMTAYDYFTKCYPSDNWYRVTGLNNHGWIDTYVPPSWERTFNYPENTHTKWMRESGFRTSTEGRI